MLYTTCCRSTVQYVHTKYLFSNIFKEQPFFPRQDSFYINCLVCVHILDIFSCNLLDTSRGWNVFPWWYQSEQADRLPDSFAGGGGGGCTDVSSCHRHTVRKNWWNFNTNEYLFMRWSESQTYIVGVSTIYDFQGTPSTNIHWMQPMLILRWATIPHVFRFKLILNE